MEKGSLKFNVNMLEGNILKSLVLFMLPFIFSNLFQQLYNTVDTIIVGQFLGEASLAAIGSSAVVYEMLIGFAFGIGSGISMVCARTYGCGDRDKLRRCVASSIVIAGIATAVLMIISIIFSKQILIWLSTPVEILSEAYSYIFTIMLFVGVTMAYNICSGILKAVGNSVMPLIFLIISSLINITLDILFIVVFHMGVNGAAIATVIAQFISMLLTIIYLLKKYPELIPGKSEFKFDRELYADLAGQGISMGLMSSLVSAGTVVMQGAINQFGYLTIAGHTAAKKIRSITMMPISTMGMALSTFVSQNRGADQGLRIRKSIKTANLLGLGWCIIISGLVFFFADPVVSFVSGSSNPEVLSNGAQYLIWNCPFYFVLSVLFNTRNSLQGIGSKTLPLWSSIIELIGKILFSIFLIPKMGYFGVIICEPVIWCLMVIELLPAFYLNKYIRAHKYA